MALSAGTRIGPYEIVALIGAGGMGEVYRATDTKLNRDVALKILPELLAGDPDRLARFRREAQVLASLNHPNIAHLYGFEEASTTAAGGGGAVHALVMELVEGPTLADLLAAARALEIGDALRIARQIADALEAAHEQGIVHRDLKPANVKVRDDGAVKVLDFGLAKALDPPAAPSQEAMNSPTLSARATQFGMILGTAAYMAPEQAKGKVVDRRADIWSFGVVLYEMLTGRRLFDAEDVSDTLAAVLTREIDWSALPADVPGRLRTLLRDCLIRDPRQRLRDIGDARIVLDQILAGTADISLTPASAAVIAPARRIWPWAAGLFAAVALASGATWALVHRPPEPPAQPVRFTIVPAATQAIWLPSAVDRNVTISPDGTHLAYIATGGTIVVRAIDQIDAETLPGISGARTPFFSPDGRWLGFFQGTTEIRKVAITGGPSILVCNVRAPSNGANWGPNDTIVFSTGNAGLFTVPGGGGEPRMLTKPDVAHGELGHRYASILPGGDAVLFTITSTMSAPGPQSASTDQIAVLDLKTGKQRTLFRGGSRAEYVDPGYLVYAAAGTLRAVGFDLGHLEVRGDAVPVLAGVATTSLGAAQFSISRAGDLVYLPGGFAASVPRSLVWIDRKGHEEPIKAPPRAYYALRLSPDGTRLALDIRDQDNDIWVWDLAHETLTRITFDPGADTFPIWTTDSRRIVYSSVPGGAPPNLFWQAADRSGLPERLTTADHIQFPMSFSPNGQSLLLKEQNAVTADDISILSMAGKPEVAPLIHTQFNERNAEVSPDGHWLAYESEESTPGQIYVLPFADVNSGGRVQVSTTGGSKPVWAASGREIFYFNDNALYAVAVQTTPKFSSGKPVKLFDVRPVPQLISGRFFDVRRDGQRFVVIKEQPPTNQPATQAQGLVVVVNWIEELKAKFPSAR